MIKNNDDLKSPRYSINGGNKENPQCQNKEKLLLIKSSNEDSKEIWSTFSFELMKTYILLWSASRQQTAR